MARSPAESVWTTILVLLILIVFGLVHGSVDEHELLVKLMHNYNPLVRPVDNVSLPVVVTLDVSLQAIIDVDEQNEQVKVNAWLNYGWKDSALLWEPKEYDNIGSVRFPMTKLWKPDVLLYNSVSDTFDSTYPTNLVLYADGSVNWIPPGIIVISCKINIFWFPFDEQLCFFKFGSWTFDGTKIDLQVANPVMDTSDYVISGEWDLYKTEAIRNLQYYDCCPEPYIDLKFYMFMRRRTLYFFMNLILPCLTLTMLTVPGFALPSDGSQKVTLQITLMLGICIFLDIVAKMSPPTSEAVPLLGVFFSTCMVLSSASVLMTVTVLNLHHRTPEFYEMSDRMRLIFCKWIPWLVFMQRTNKPIRRRSLQNVCSSSCCQCQCTQASGQPYGTDLETASTGSTCSHQPNLSDMDLRIIQCYRKLAQHQHKLSTFMQNSTVLLYMSYTDVKKISARMKQADLDDEARNEWVFAANALDRLVFYLLLLLILGSTCFIFFSAPYLHIPMDPTESK